MSASALVLRPADLDAADLDLVAAVRRGDDRAFEALYARYQPRITAYVRGLVHDHGRAEDITQEVFMSALRRMRGTEAAIAFKPWIYEIAKNACIDAWRRSRNTNEISIDAQDALGADDHGRLADPRLTPDSVVDTKDTLDNLCGAFGGLSQAHHEILVMRELEGLSYREIGERMGMSRPGVESTLFRARRRLSEEYEELVSGERCLRVQRIIDSPGGRPTGLREQRRMDRHLSHCQPCRRYARLAGIDLDPAARPASRRGATTTRIAGWLPLPLFARRRWEDGSSELVSHAHHGPVAQWSASVASSVDPGLVSGWSKAAATAATVAVASLGAGAAIHEHKAIERIVGGGAKPSQQHAAPRAHDGAAASAGDRRTPATHRGRSSHAGAPAAGAGAGAAAAGRATSARRAVVAVEEHRHSIAAGDAPARAAQPPAVLKSDAAHDAVTALANGPVGAPPGATTAGTSAGQSLSQVVSGLGASAPVGDAAPPVGSVDASAPTDAQGPIAGAVTQAGATVGTLSGSAPAPPAATTIRPATTAPSLVTTATALIDSVSGTVNQALASTTASRTAP